MTIPVTQPILYGDIVPDKFAHNPLEAVVSEPKVLVADDVLLVPGHLFVDRRSGTVLPASYEIVMATGAKTGLGSRPPRLWQSPDEAAELFVVDCFSTDNYGHNLLEALPRLMLLDRVPAHVGIATSIPRTLTVEKMIGALGIDPSRVRYYREPLFCQRAWLPDRLVLLEEFIHPLARQAFSRIGSLAETSTIDRPERIFISRSRIHRRRLINEAEIEQLFERYGFKIIHPEVLPIEDQIALFRDADMIAGLGGSAMHSTVFSRPETKVLMVSSKGWFVHMDMLINEQVGQLGYVFGEPEGVAIGLGDGDWRVDPAAVEAAIVAHFGL